MEPLDTNTIIKALYSCGIKKPVSIHRLTQRAHAKGSISTIKRKVKDLDNGIDIEEPNNANKGRHHILTEENKMEIEELLDEDPLLNSVQIVAQANLNCTPRTVRNFLHEQGYVWKPVKSKFQLDPIYFPARANFAKNHLEDTWEDTVFLDESTFRLNTSATYCYQKKGKKVIHEKPKYCQKVNVCAAISFQGPTMLFTFKENLDAELLKNILIDSILPDCRTMHGRRFRLAWDQDSKHTSLLVKNFLNSRHVSRLEDWPPLSPDINPIEQIWAILKQALKAYKPKPTTPDELEEVLLYLWQENISQQLCKSIISTMPDRMKKLKKCKGRRIEDE